MRCSDGYSYLAYSQSVSATASGQTSAQVLTQALNAMGGSAAWTQVSDATLIGNCTTPQGQDGTAPATEPFRWITQAGEFRYESGSTGQLYVLLSGHGAPSNASPSGTQNLISETSALLKPFHLPGQVFATILNDPSYVASVVAPSGPADSATIHIHVVHQLSRAVEFNSQQDWWLDASTYLPVSVTFRVPGQAIRSYMLETYTFSAWSAEKFGAVLPHQITTSMSVGILAQTCTTTEVQINTQPAASLFDAR